MSLIQSNELGAIAVNNKVICRLITETMLDMNKKLIPCSKKGKVVKSRPTPLVDADFYDAVEFSESKNSIKVRTYIILVNDENDASDAAEMLTDNIENIFVTLGIRKPDNITVTVKGILGKQLLKKDIEFCRVNYDEMV